MANALNGLKPKAVWEFFEQICQYPRPSKKEEKIANFLINWAKERNFEVQKDSFGNFVIRKPATIGFEDRKPVAIQGHIDMVCEKNSDTIHDFENDPIQPYIDGDWVKAKGTTLGADNGIGIAMGMAVLDSSDIDHPPIELLCTLDEETGLTGANSLSRDLLKAEILINLDSEEEGAFTIGCAGGMNTSGTFAYQEDTIPEGSIAYNLAIKGLQGGHSGIEIHDGRANAIKLLNRLLYYLSSKIDIRLSFFKAGNAHNAIPREAFSIISLPASQDNEFKKLVEEYHKLIKAEYLSKEPGINQFCESVELPTRALTKDLQNKILKSFYAMPHGVYRMSPDIKGLVQTSTNFAIVDTRDNEIFILTSQRSSMESEKQDIATKVRISLELGGAEVKHGEGYPAWPPNVNSPILNTAIEVFKGMYNKEPKVEAIHAGLECGLIGEKYPGMDMLSFGPNLKDVHSPDEKIQISSTERVFDLLINILKNIPRKG